MPGIILQNPPLKKLKYLINNLIRVMKKIASVLYFLFAISTAFAQKETFDLATYTVPKFWKKQPAGNAVQFTRQDAAKGIYCVISLFKGVEGTADSKDNFDMAWTSMVKEMVNVDTVPTMEAVEK